MARRARPRTTIALSCSTARSSPPIRAIRHALAHEAQRARDFVAIGDARTTDECYAVEARAYLTSAALWQRWYGPSGKPNPATDYERNANAILARHPRRPGGLCRPRARTLCARLPPPGPRRG